MDNRYRSQSYSFNNNRSNTPYNNNNQPQYSNNSNSRSNHPLQYQSSYGSYSNMSNSHMSNMSNMSNIPSMNSHSSNNGYYNSNGCMQQQQGQSPPAGAPNNNSHNQYQSQRRQRAQSMGSHYNQYPQQQQFARSQGQYQNGSQPHQQSHYHQQQQTRTQQPRYQPSYSQQPQPQFARNNGHNNHNQYGSHNGHNGHVQGQNNGTHNNNASAGQRNAYSLSPQPNQMSMNGATVPVPPLTKLSQSRSYGRIDLDTRSKSFSPNNSTHSHPTPTYNAHGNGHHHNHQHVQGQGSGSRPSTHQLPIIEPVQSAPKMTMAVSQPRLNASVSHTQLLPAHSAGTVPIPAQPGMTRSYSARSSLVSNTSNPRSQAMCNLQSHHSQTSAASNRSSVLMGPGGIAQPVENLTGMVMLDDDLNDDLLKDMNFPSDEILETEFEALGIEIGHTPSPPPMQPLTLHSAAKPSINLDDNAKKPVLPKFKSFTNVEDAKKASDKELEAGFTMLGSPTASVQTEYNDSEDLTQNNEDNKDSK